MQVTRSNPNKRNAKDPEYARRLLSEEELAHIVRSAFARWGLDGKRVLIIIPGAIRSGPVLKEIWCSYD